LNTSLLIKLKSIWRRKQRLFSASTKNRP